MQKTTNLNFLIKQTNEIGRGIFAKRAIKAGELILKFKGRKTTRKYEDYTLQIGPKAHIAVTGSGRFVNHSCNPNCGIKGKTELVAIKNIRRGEEITFDYAMTEKLLSGKEKCLCGSKNCRGVILGYDQIPDEIKKRYKGYVSDYLTN